MKYCKQCGKENNDENVFCFNCRSNEFSDEPASAANSDGSSNPAPNVNQQPRPQQPGFVPPPPMQTQPYYQSVYAKPKEKKPLTIFDVLSILGFVAAIVGMFSTSIILHPLAAISSIAGFIGNTKFKPLATAAFVIAIVGGIVYISLSLYRNGLIPEWITDGAFH
ncbi:MAG: hypothetical protein NC203_06380 [Firmicutes bacterium]|nr:hypothetical protein [[Eubacterium] siraeum]MCM1487973.1 hypothetical protein [Bacillota bacterium]